MIDFYDNCITDYGDITMIDFHSKIFQLAYFLYVLSMSPCILMIDTST